MDFVKRTLSCNDLFELPRRKLILGIFVAVLTSFCWYAFFFVMRETMRIAFYWRDYSELLILTDKEVSFYNFVFAAVASIFGLCECFRFWFWRAKKFGENGIDHFRKSSILTDITASNAVFLSWFFRAATFFTMMGAINLTWCYFPLYPSWNFLWILVILFLFSDMWKTIRKVAFRKSRRWILISLTAIMIWSFFLSRIQIIDYRAVNQAYIDNNISLKYNIQYPKSDYYRMMVNRSLIVNIYMCYPGDSTSIDTPKVFVENEECGVDQLKEKLRESFENYYDEDKKLAFVVLRIDKNIRVKHVRQLQDHLRRIGLLRMAYKILPSDKDDCSRTVPYVLIRALPQHSDSDSDPIIPVSPYNYDISNYDAPIHVTLTPTGLFINDQPIDLQDMESTIRKFVLEHPDYLVVLDIDDQCTYNDYIRIFGELFKVFFNLRNEKSLEAYQIPFDDLSYEPRDEMLKRYGSKVYELTKTDKK